MNMVVMKGLLDKYQSQQMKFYLFLFQHLKQTDNEKTTYSFCSLREFMFNECPQSIYDQVNQSIFNAQLYFIRSVFKFDLLTPQQQYFIKMNADLSFYSRAAFLASQQSGLIQIKSVHNSDTTSAYTVSPSVLYNYTQSVYQTCEGNQYTEPYDPRCRFWYQYAQKNKGLFIYQPYNDATTGALQMTLSTQILNDSQFYSVSAIIFYIQNLVKTFDSYLSQNSYTVLFHEFNSSVFYHPLLLFYQTTTWIDLEFFNINQLCNNSSEEMSICLSQKNNLQNQINSTIEFIKNGNYSIEKKQNLKYLYQYWERFGQKQASMVFPIQSKLKGNNNQQPYSNSILLISRVIKDNSDQLKQYNLQNADLIRAYLLVGFAILSVMILIFIINYGYFLIFQIQNPIELLILFLNKSYIEQMTYQINSNQNKIEKQMDQEIQKQLLQMKRKSNQSKKPLEKQSFLQRLRQNKKQNNQNQNTKQQQMQENSNLQPYKLTNSIFQKNQLYFSFNNSKSQNFSPSIRQNADRNSETSPIKILTQQSPQLAPNSSEKICDSSQKSQLIQKNSLNLESNNKEVNANNQQFTTSSLRTVTEKSNFSMLNDEKNKQKHHKQILQGLKPSFYEMKVIKKVFQDLESLINYTIDAQSYNSEDFTKSLFHFSKAKSTFMQLKNQVGLGRCYYNLGIVSLMNNNYTIAQEYFECAIQVSFENLGIDYENLKNYRILNKSQNDYEKQILILLKRIFSKAHCQKQSALQAFYSSQNKIISNEVTQQLKQSLSIFQKVQKFVENNKFNFQEEFQIFLYQEMIEVLIFLKQNDNDNHFMNKLLQKVQLLLLNTLNCQGNQKDGVRKVSLNYKKFILPENGIKKQILQIQKSRQQFLLGLNEQNKNNKVEALEFLTLSLEEGSHYSPALRKKVIYHLSQEMQDIKNPCLQQMMFKDKNNLLVNQNSQIDFIVLLELDYYRFHSNVERILENIFKSNFFKENDRMQILIYQSEIHVFMPFTIIKNAQHRNLIINSLKEIQRTIIEDETKKQLSWQEALIESFNFTYDFQMNDLVVLKKYLKEKQNKIQVDQNNLQQTFDNNCEILTILKNDTKKVILLISKDQQNSNEYIFNNNFVFKQKSVKQEKNFVYHLKEYQLYKNDQKYFDSPQIRYELFYEESQLINQLIEIKNQEILNDESEFLSILYNS